MQARSREHRLTGSLLLCTVVLSLLGLAAIRHQGEQFAKHRVPSQYDLADRVLYYRCTTDEDVEFRVSGNEPHLRMVTHLVLPPDEAFDARKRFSYGFQLIIRTPEGGKFWSRRVFTESRQSKAGFDGQGWTIENAFGAESARQLTDDRVFRITIPHETPAGSRLSMRLISETGSSSLIRIYRRTEADTADRLVAWLGTASDQQTDLLRRITYLTWENLTHDQRSEQLQRRWERLTAMDSTGMDAPTESVYFTGFHAPVPRGLHEPVTVAPGTPVAMTIRGPGTVRLEVPDGCSPRLPPQDVDITHVDGGGVRRRHALSTCPGTLALRVSKGPHSFYLRTQPGSEGVPVRGELARERQLQSPQSSRRTAVIPMRRRISTYRIGPQRPAWETLLGGPGDLHSRILRLRIRWLSSPGELSEPETRTAAIHYRFVDADGSVVGENTWRVETDRQPAHFERVRDPRTDEVWIPTESVSSRIIVPEGARKIVVDADRDIAMSLATFFPLPQDTKRPNLEPPYGDDLLPGARWRYAPLASRNWYGLRASNHEQLVATGGALEFVAQTRLDPWSATEVELARTTDATAHRESAPRQWATLDPVRSREQQIALERIDPDTEQRGSVYSAIPSRGTAEVLIDDVHPTRVLYRSDGPPEDVLGRVVRFQIEGETHDRRVMSSRGRWNLPALEPGRRKLSVDAHGQDLRILLNRYVRGRGNKYRRRTLHRLGHPGLRIRVKKRHSDPIHVNAVLYRCDANHRSNRVELLLDGGRPERVASTPVPFVTRARWETELPAQGAPTELLFLTRSVDRCVIAGRLAFALGADIARGLHDIRIRVLDGPPLWARFFRSGEGHQRRRALRWIESTAQPMDLQEP